MKKLLVINGSPRDDRISNTYKALMAEADFYKKKFPELQIVYKKYHLTSRDAGIAKNVILAVI